MNDRERVIRDRDERQKAREEEFNKKRREHEERMGHTGRTTRMVDKYIQELFYKGEVILRDHHEDGNSDTGNRNLSDIFERRMNAEHRNVNVNYRTVGNVTTAKIVK